MKIQILLGLYCFLIITGCKNSNKVEDISDVSDSTNISLENLSLIKTQDYLTFKDSVIYLSDRVVVKGGVNRLVFVDKLKAYVTDLNLNIQKIISFEDKDYFFEGRIFDIELIGNKLLLIDKSNIVKEISLNEDNEINKINLDIESSNSTYNGSVLSMVRVGDSKILTSNFVTEAQYYSNNIEFGKLFDLEGNFKNTFRIKSSEADTYWRTLGDWCWVSYYKNKVYFFFTISRKVFVFNINGKLLNVYELEVDKRYWQEPIVGETQTTIKDGATMTSKYSNYVSICWKSPQIKNGYIYALMYQGKEKGPKIVKYNLDLELIEEKESDNTVPGYMNYNLLIAGKRLYIFYDNIINIYE